MPKSIKFDVARGESLAETLRAKTVQARITQEALRAEAAENKVSDEAANRLRRKAEVAKYIAKELPRTLQSIDARMLNAADREHVSVVKEWTVNKTTGGLYNPGRVVYRDLVEVANEIDNITALRAKVAEHYTQEGLTVVGMFDNDMTMPEHDDGNTYQNVIGYVYGIEISWADEVAQSVEQ